MYALAELIKANGDELAELESLDNGKPLAAAKGDIAATVNHLRYYAGWPTKIEGETIPVSARDVLCYTLREPVGVCAQIVPWNFPLLMAIWKVAPALAAGCTIVLKPAEQTPLTALRLGELALEAGFPEGTLNVLTGDGETGAALVDHPGVDKVAFTGSTVVGREIGAKCGRALKRVTLELGGKSPNIILPDADLDARDPGLLPGHLLQLRPGLQRRLAPVRRSASCSTRWSSGLAAFAREAKVGPGLDPETEFGPLVSEEQFERVKGYIDSGVAEGAEVVAGGTPHGDGNGGGYFVDPTLFTGVEDSMRIAREEIFGPVLVAMPFEDLEEVARRANDTEYGLAAGLWTRDISNAHKLAGDAPGGQRLHQHLGRRRPGGPVRRLQGLGHRPREGPRQPRRLPRDQDGLGPALAAAGSTICAAICAAATVCKARDLASSEAPVELQAARLSQQPARHPAHRPCHGPALGVSPSPRSPSPKALKVRGGRWTRRLEGRTRACRVGGDEVWGAWNGDGRSGDRGEARGDRARGEDGVAGGRQREGRCLGCRGGRGGQRGVVRGCGELR